MNNREEFEEWLKNKFCYSERRWKELLKYDESYYTFWISISYDAWQEATARQQKIIDELKANNFAMSAMVCKHPDKRTLDENYDSTKDYCDMLIAENPDVPCPACEGTLSTVKALQYEIEQLENKIKHLQDSAQKCFDNLSKCGI